MNLPGSYELTTWQNDQLVGAGDEQLDAAVRCLVDACHMPTPILALSYHTEPSFRAALCCRGHEHHLVYSRRDNRTELASLGIRSLRTVRLHQREAKLAYIHHLRVHPKHAGGTLLARGYQAFREVSRQSPAAVTLTSILEGNHTARALLANQNGRGPLPAYQPLVRYLTALIPLRGPGKRWPCRFREVGRRALMIRNLTLDDAAVLEELVTRTGAHHDGITYEPPIRGEWSSHSLWPGLQMSDLVGVFRGTTLLGAVGVWNRGVVEQIRLASLHPALSGMQRIWHIGRKIWGECPLPAVGTEVPHLLLDPWFVEPGMEEEVGLPLVAAALKQAQARGALFAAFGVPEGHGLRNVVNRFFHLPYWSMLYAVRWPETPQIPSNLAERLIVSLGTL